MPPYTSLPPPAAALPAYHRCLFVACPLPARTRRQEIGYTLVRHFLPLARGPAGPFSFPSPIRDRKPSLPRFVCFVALPPPPFDLPQESVLSQSTSQTNSPPGAKAPVTRSLWIRLISAQETGLVAVILALVCGLYLSTPSIEQTERTTYNAPGTIVTDAPDGFTITVPAGPSGQAATTLTFKEAGGYEYRPLDPGAMVIRKFQANKFLNAANLLSVLTAASFIAIMAVGMTGIIVSGGIDLSVGSIYALAAVIGALALKSVVGTSSAPIDGANMLWAITVTIAVCCAVGAVCGFVNGFASVGLKVHPFIITLGGMAVYRGIAFVSTGGQTIGPFPDGYITSFGKLQLFGITPIPMLLMFLIAGIGYFILSKTVFGRRVYAIGGNEIAAKYAGVPVGAAKVQLFVICGMLAGLSAALYLGYYGAGSSDAGQGYELNVIAAAVVGGASLSGGRGSAIGAVLGAIVIQLIDNSILMLSIDQNYKNIVIGLAIVLAVVVDQTKHRLFAGAKH